MPLRGPLNHIDLSASDPERSIAFYGTLLETLGYRRMQIDLEGFRGRRPRRAAWQLQIEGGASFGIEVRPSSGPHRDRPHDRYAPGLHHLAFHAMSAEDVDRVHDAMCDVEATVLDAPVDYSGRSGYSDGYYACFFADPDGLKIEVAYVPGWNP